MENEETAQDVKRNGGVEVEVCGKKLILFYDNSTLFDLQDEVGKPVGEIAGNLQGKALDIKLLCQALYYGLKRVHPDYTMEKLGEMRIAIEDSVVIKHYLCKAMLNSYIDEKELKEMGELAKKASRVEGQVMMEQIKLAKMEMERQLKNLKKLGRSGEDTPSMTLVSRIKSSGDLHPENSITSHTGGLKEGEEETTE